MQRVVRPLARSKAVCIQGGTICAPHPECDSLIGAAVEGVVPSAIVVDRGMVDVQGGDEGRRRRRFTM